NSLTETLESVQVIGGLGEDGVGTRLNTSMGAFNGSVFTFHGNGVGTGDDVELVVGASIHRRFHSVRHFLRADDFLAGAMATALGANLVFNMTAGRTEFGEALDGARNIEGGGAKARVDIHNQGHVADIGDATDVY